MGWVRTEAEWIEHPFGTQNACRTVVYRVRGPVLISADSRSLLNANHSPLCSFQAHLDAALESSTSALSNAVSTSIWELCVVNGR